MNEHNEIAAVFNQGLEPVMDQTPEPPDWESLQFEMGSTAQGAGRGWLIAAAAALVVLVGVGSVALLGRVGGSDDAVVGDTVTTSAAQDTAFSIVGRWVFESWQEGDEQIMVEVGENAAGEPWLEFGADGTFTGSTGCNGIRSTDYEFSGGFLTHGQVVQQMMGCEPNRAEEVLDAMLGNTPDGIEVIADGDRMEWYGSNLEGMTKSITFRRDGAPLGERTSTTAPAAEGQPVFAVYDVGGVEVVTPTMLAELPEQATRVRFMTTVIDSGNGPELCLGGVMDSLPPQCSGPVTEGLNMDGWSEEASGVRWGEQTVVVTWPPVDGAVQVESQSDAVFPSIDYPPGRLPAECAGIDTGAGAGAINSYANSLGDANGGLYVTNDGTLVLQVVGDPEPHREALAAQGGACVIEVTRTEAEQRRIQDALAPLLGDVPELVQNYAISTGPGGRVDISVPVADQAVARAIASLVDDPTAIRIVGSGVLLSADAGTASALETYVVGGNVWIRTDCPAADDILRSDIGDGLPEKGQTDKERVETLLVGGKDALLESVGGLAAEAIPRRGQVWAGPGDGDYTIEEADDYQIRVTQKPDAPCPAAPYSWNGIPVLFFRG